MFQHIFHCIIVVHVVKHQSVIIIININKYMLLKLCIFYVANYSAYVYGECLYLYITKDVLDEWGELAGHKDLCGDF